MIEGETTSFDSDRRRGRRRSSTCMAIQQQGDRRSHSEPGVDDRQRQQNQRGQLSGGDEKPGRQFAVSEEVKLTVVQPVTILGQPEGATKLLGQALTLSVVASGSEPLVYEWHKDGQAIAGAAKPKERWPLKRLATTDAASYTVSISNEAGNRGERLSRDHRARADHDYATTGGGASDRGRDHVIHSDERRGRRRSSTHGDSTARRSTEQVARC